MNENWLQATLVVLSLLATLLAVSATLVWLAYRKLRETRVPPGADFFTTLRAVPFTLVAALDLLDLTLDFLALPIVWIVLSRFNLQGLRNVAALEALVPLTQPLPVMTLAWLLARALNLGQPLPPAQV
jgi:hypothetical protein